MSAINTNSLNVNYPTPGINNSTQGFRDNFTTTKTNLDTAKTEITDLQTKAIVKSGLNGITLNNDMNGTLISNALVRSFTATTHNLGSSIPSSLFIDVSKGDVQYGTIDKDTTISFGGWGRTGTQSNLELRLTVANSSATIYFPDSTFNAGAVLTQGMTTSARVLENYGSNGYPTTNTTYSNQVTAPAGVQTLQYKLSTVDCGQTLDIYPLNRNQIAGRIELRKPLSIGAPGDTAGAICTDGEKVYICIGIYDGSSQIWGSIGQGIYGI
jgi:hypothetical protein